jgi:ATP-dependent Clp protease adaptor protein ClpS
VSAVSQQSAVAEPVVEVDEKTKAGERRKPKRQPPYHVILWNDDDHTYQYVIGMLQELFGHTAEVDTAGRAVVMTTTLERAELKRDQIHAYGKDKAIARCKGSMKASIEAAE